MPQCAYHDDPFEETGRCPEVEYLHWHLGAHWCATHLVQIKAAETRAITQKAHALSTRKI
jgi:hypothetical protein